MQLFTIGYEGLSTAPFIDILTAHGVQTLIDVRAVPLSRKPGFSKTPLSRLCVEHSIEYCHWGLLGCPRDIRRDYQAVGDWSDYTRRFLAYLETQHQTLELLSGSVAARSCALLCFEADARFCHRYFIAQKLEQQFLSDLRIQHLDAFSRNPVVLGAESRFVVADR